MLFPISITLLMSLSLILPLSLSLLPSLSFSLYGPTVSRKMIKFSKIGESVDVFP